MRSAPRLYPAIPILSLREHCLIPAAGVVNEVSAAERTARCVPLRRKPSRQYLAMYIVR